MEKRQKVFSATFIASGNVQGVGFRDFACRIGASAGLVGYAKNLQDGTVEIAAEGSEAQLQELARRVSVRMPLGIHVKELREISRKEVPRRTFSSFSVRF
jgi:acylphosphatase